MSKYKSVKTDYHCIISSTQIENLILLSILASKIQISGATAALLKTDPLYTVLPRGEILVKVMFPV